MEWGNLKACRIMELSNISNTLTISSCGRGISEEQKSHNRKNGKYRNNHKKLNKSKTRNCMVRVISLPKI